MVWKKSAICSSWAYRIPDSSRRPAPPLSIRRPPSLFDSYRLSQCRAVAWAGPSVAQSILAARVLNDRLDTVTRSIADIVTRSILTILFRVTRSIDYYNLIHISYCNSIDIDYRTSLPERPWGLFERASNGVDEDGGHGNYRLLVFLQHTCNYCSTKYMNQGLIISNNTSAIIDHLLVLLHDAWLPYSLIDIE